VLYLLPAGRYDCLALADVALERLTNLPNSFSELMPIVFNVVFGVPQMLSNIQYVVFT